MSEPVMPSLGNLMKASGLNGAASVKGGNSLLPGIGGQQQQHKIGGKRKSKRKQGGKRKQSKSKKSKQGGKSKQNKSKKSKQ